MFNRVGRFFVLKCIMFPRIRLSYTSLKIFICMFLVLNWRSAHWIKVNIIFKQKLYCSKKWIFDFLISVEKQSKSKNQKAFERFEMVKNVCRYKVVQLCKLEIFF